MEIVLKNMEGNSLYKLNTHLSSSNIYGFYGEGKEEFLGLLKDFSFDKGIITVDNERLLKKDYPSFTRKIKVLEELVFDTVEQELKSFIIENKLELKDENEKISTALKLVGLANNYLTRNINSLSTVEKKLVALSKMLLGDYEILIIDDLFELLDRKLRQKIYRLLIKLKEKKNIIILLGSKDMDIVYQYTDRMIVFDHKEIFLDIMSKEIINHLDQLTEHNIDVPDILMITYKAKQKGIKIDYHKDIRDLIKDVYKHV